MDCIADSGAGGDAPSPITGASTDREDKDAGMGLLADGRRRRETSDHHTARARPHPPSSGRYLRDFDAALRAVVVGGNSRATYGNPKVLFVDYVSAARG